MMASRSTHLRTLTRSVQYLLGSDLVRNTRGLGISFGKNIRGISMSSKLSAAVRISQKGPVNVITMDRPKQKNAVNKDMWLDLTEAIAQSEANKSTHITVLAGGPDFFCTGLDLAEHREASLASNLPTYAKNCTEYLRKFTGTLIDCKKPIVALVHGSAFGIGVTLLPHCDFVYCSNKSTFTTPFTRLGIVAECCSSYTFPKIMGYTLASSMLFNNKTVDAEEALRIGLVTEIFSHEEFQEKTEKLIKGITALPVESLMFSKELVRGRERDILHQVNETESRGIENFLQSRETEEAVRKFFEKKK